MFQPWVQRLMPAVDRYMDGFEARLGYAPGDQRVTAGNGHDGSDLARTLSPAHVPDDLVAFYNFIAEVHLPDLWNGYFLGPASATAAAYAAHEPGWLAEPHGRTPVLLVGSDGGGNLYVVRAEPASQVLRLSEVAIQDGVADAQGFGKVTVVGESVTDFLHRLLEGIEALADGREPLF